MKKTSKKQKPERPALHDNIVLIPIGFSKKVGDKLKEQFDDAMRVKIGKKRL